MLDNNEITGIILAGGASRRMGKDKGLCEFKGKPLVTYAIDALIPICDNILISSNNTEDYLKFGFDIINDEYKNIGPIGGIFSSLNKSNTKHNIIISCDTPFINTQLLEYILKNVENYDIVVPEHGNSYIEPLAGYYTTSIISVLKNSIKAKDYKLMNLFNKVKFKTVRVNSITNYSQNLFKNLNTPSDLLSC